MTWVRLDENFAQHPKIAKAGALAMAMQVAGLCYCNRNLTDGFIPRAVARTLLDWQVVDSKGAVHTIGRTTGMAGNDVTSEWVIGLLVEVGVWVEQPHGYRIHDYLEYQPSADNVKQQREKTKNRVNQWRSKNRQESNGAGNATGNDVRNAATNAGVTPAPDTDTDTDTDTEERVEGAQATPAPAANGAHSTETREARGKRLDVHALPDEWRRFCRESRGELDPDQTWQHFHDYWVAQPGSKGRKTDWQATWRNWVRTEKAPEKKTKTDYSSW